jgi:hypothetical protein
MSPQRTAEAIAAQTATILTNGDYITESAVDTKISNLGGNGLTVANGVIDIDDPFDPSGTYTNLSAQATTATDVGLGNVTNESKETMFTNPTFTGTVSGVTAEMVDLGNVTNESKATMFSNPTFTDTVTIAGDNPKLTGLPLPIDSSDAANKTYVDNVASGLKGRTSALVLVDFNLDATYDGVPELAELEANANVAFPDVDGILSAVLNVEDTRFLLIGQTNKAHNGLYVLKTAGVTGTSP